MKRILFLACIGTVALSLTALGAPKQGKSAKGPARAPTARAAGHSMSHGSAMKGTRGPAHVQSAPMARNVSRGHGGGNAAFRQQAKVNHGNKNMNRGNRAAFVNNQAAMARTSKANARAAKVNGRAARQQARVNTNQQVAANNGQFINGKGRNGRNAVVNGAATAANPRVANGRNAVVNGVATNRVASAPIVNNWQNVGGQNYSAFRDYHHHQWHNRGWWDNNYSNIILVGGGYWAWAGGYWYPAWGYDPYYSTYAYDGPIYGYNNLTPDQIIVNVQTQLRDEGYYVGSIDGILGPQTRRAIAAFQADHGLAVTSAVDQPTLATLGLS